jgi:fructosamine-3-kinase
MSHIVTMTPEPQRLRALERANEVRLARAYLKRQIAEGEVSVADVILESPWEASSWALGELLLSQRRWGSTRSRKFLTRLQIAETKQVGTLTERQRRILAAQLETRVSCELELVGA